MDRFADGSTLFRVLVPWFIIQCRRATCLYGSFVNLISFGCWWCCSGLFYYVVSWCNRCFVFRFLHRKFVNFVVLRCFVSWFYNWCSLVPVDIAMLTITFCTIVRGIKQQFCSSVCSIVKLKLFNINNFIDGRGNLWKRDYRGKVGWICWREWCTLH